MDTLVNIEHKLFIHRPHLAEKPPKVREGGYSRQLCSCNDWGFTQSNNTSVKTLNWL